MNFVKFEIIGEPCGKGRPRFANRGGFTVAYTDSKTSNYENLVKLTYMQQVGNKKFNKDVSLAVCIYCYFKRPSNIPKNKITLYDNSIIRPTKKPDTDNIAKIILDSLNNVAYDDDKQVVELLIKKYYTEKHDGQPRVMVVIQKIGEN